MYEMLVGHPAFRGEDVTEILGLPEYVLAFADRPLGRPHFGRPSGPWFETAVLELENLLLCDSPRGHAAACGNHADRVRPRGDVGPELPLPVGRTDGNRGDESSWAGCASVDAVVDFVARGETVAGDPRVHTFHAQLTRVEDLLGKADAHCIRRGRRRRRRRRRRVGGHGL